MKCTQMRARVEKVDVFGWNKSVGGFLSEETLAGSYRIDRIGWIVSVSILCLLGETGFYALDGLLLSGWDG